MTGPISDAEKVKQAANAVKDAAEASKTATAAAKDVSITEHIKSIVGGQVGVGVVGIVITILKDFEEKLREKPPSEVLDDIISMNPAQRAAALDRIAKAVSDFSYPSLVKALCKIIEGKTDPEARRQALDMVLKLDQHQFHVLMMMATTTPLQWYLHEIIKGESVIAKEVRARIRKYAESAAKNADKANREGLLPLLQSIAQPLERWSGSKKNSVGRWIDAQRAAIATRAAERRAR